jgi:hypothetical protein
MNEFLRPSLCAYLDILGFAAAIDRAYSEGKEANLLTEISRALSVAAGDIKSAGERLPMVSVKFFTDNVVIGYSYWTKGAKAELSHFCELVAEFQLAMACMGFFIRGGISIGTLASNDNIVFGDALVKAHRLEAIEAVNPRVVIDRRLKETLEQSLPSSEETERNTWKSRLMSDVDGYFFVNYLSALYDQLRLHPQHGRVWYPNEDKLMTHREKIEQQLKSKRTEPKIWSKYFWVANYHDSFCDLHGLKHCKVDETLLLPKPVIIG